MLSKIETSIAEGDYVYFRKGISTNRQISPFKKYKVISVDRKGLSFYDERGDITDMTFKGTWEELEGKKYIEAERYIEVCEQKK